MKFCALCVKSNFKEVVGCVAKFLRAGNRVFSFAARKFLFLDFAARKKNFIQVCSDLLEVTGYKNEPYHGHWIEMNQKSNLDFWLISILCHGRHETALLFPPASGWPMVCYNISNSTTLPNYHMVTIPPCMYKYVCTPLSFNEHSNKDFLRQALPSLIPLSYK